MADKDQQLSHLQGMCNGMLQELQMPWCLHIGFGDALNDAYASVHG